MSDQEEVNGGLSYWDQLWLDCQPEEGDGRVTREVKKILAQGLPPDYLPKAVEEQGGGGD